MPFQSLTQNPIQQDNLYIYQKTKKQSITVHKTKISV